MKKRKILVFAHVPPPHHGQSVMVQIMLEGLRADPRSEVHHVDARVSDDLEDVGSFRPQKFWRLFQCILQAWWIRLRYGRMAFYYVPAPAKRSAIIRDWVVMALCRPVFPELILHWHAFGLGEWVAAGKDWQRKLTRWALGRADLSIVLNNYNKRDAEVFAPMRIEVVPNGIADQFPDYEIALAPKRKARADQVGRWESGKVGRYEGTRGLRDEGTEGQKYEGGKVGMLEVVRFLFLGHLIESKGVFVAIEATRLANEELAKQNAPWRAHLTLAGSFASEDEKVRVQQAMEKANEAADGCGVKVGKWESGNVEKVNEVASGEGGVGAGSSVFPCFGNSEGAGDRVQRAEGRGEMIRLAGFLDAGQKKSALEEADCLVFPTFYEGETQGLVLLEAMSAGLPVITTSWRGVPEVLPEGYPWVVTPGSDQELGQAMIAVAGNAWSAVLRHRYVEHYTISKHVELLARKLSGLCEETASSSAV